MPEENFWTHKSEIKLVSVQSAKGGVGKTMLSFLLANHLRAQDENARVVVIDLDFTGTSVADLFEKVKDSDKGPHDIPVRLLRTKEGKTTLLNLFDEYLQQGHVLRQSLKAADIRTWMCDREYVFHMASGSVYDKGRDAFFANVLSEANHALWFVDFLFDLFFHIEQSLREEDGEAAVTGPLYIILDNAPGQSVLLPILQERMLRWGRHRAKFIQVASLDEMDIRASLAVLSHLSDRGETIHETKRAMAGDLQEVAEWKNLTKRLEQEEIDRNLFEDILAEDDSTIAAAIENGKQEAEAPNYMTLVINRVFETADLGRVDSFILDQAGKLEPKKQKPTRDFLTGLRRAPFPFDQALGLFFQEQFLQKRPETSKPISAAVKKIPEHASDGSGWDGLANHDVTVYRTLYTGTAIQDAGFLKRSLIRGVGVRDVSHLMRGFDVMGRLLDLCHRIVRTRRSEIPEAEDLSTAFRLEVMRALEAELGLAAEDRAGSGLLTTLRSLSFVNRCLRERLKPLEPSLREQTLESFRKRICHADGIVIPPLVQEILDLSFVIYGVFVAYPLGLDEDPAEKRATLKATHEAFFESIYTVAYAIVGTVITAAQSKGKTPPPDLCKRLEVRLKELNLDLLQNVHSFQLELAKVAELIELYDRSLGHGARASSMLVQLVDGLSKGNPAMTELTELYVHTVLADLFHGVRADTDQVHMADQVHIVDQVHREVLNLLGNPGADARPQLTARIEQRLGRIWLHLFAKEDADADA